MQLSLIFSVVFPCAALAMPAVSENESNLFARDAPKLNQYRSLSDCQNDRGILYHASPAPGNCYELDGQTGAFFYNTGGYLNAYVSRDNGCRQTDVRYLKGGACMEKGDFKSVRMV
jgi:hypothetical protein